MCPKGYYIAIVSTIAENSSNHHLELQPGFERLGKIEEKFMGAPIPLYEPLESGMNDNIFISKSYDATSHFETTTGKVPPILISVSNFNISYRRRERHLSAGRGRRACCRGTTGRYQPGRSGMKCSMFYESMNQTFPLRKYIATALGLCGIDLVGDWYSPFETPWLEGKL